MKQIILAIVLIVSSLSAFAQRHPHPGPHHGPYRPGPVVVHRPMPPMPRPMPHPVPRPMPPTRMCRVVMTDRMNRVVRNYQSTMDFNGMCRDGLRQCNYDLQMMGGWGYRCATVRW